MVAAVGATGTSGQGNAGGSALNSGSYNGGGGGGAGAVVVWMLLLVFLAMVVQDCHLLFLVLLFGMQVVEEEWEVALVSLGGGAAGARWRHGKGAGNGAGQRRRRHRHHPVSDWVSEIWRYCRRPVLSKVVLLALMKMVPTRARPL